MRLICEGEIRAQESHLGGPAHLQRQPSVWFAVSEGCEGVSYRDAGHSLRPVLKSGCRLQATDYSRTCDETSVCNNLEYNQSLVYCVSQGELSFTSLFDTADSSES